VHLLVAKRYAASVPASRLMKKKIVDRIEIGNALADVVRNAQIYKIKKKFGLAVLRPLSHLCPGVFVFFENAVN
jgi:hypothetical protein